MLRCLPHASKVRRERQLLVGRGKARCQAQKLGMPLDTVKFVSATLGKPVMNTSKNVNMGDEDLASTAAGSSHPGNATVLSTPPSATTQQYGGAISKEYVSVEEQPKHQAMVSNNG